MRLLYLLLLLVSCKSESEEKMLGPINPEAPMLWSGHFPMNMAISDAFSVTERTQINNMLSSWEDSEAYEHDFFSSYTLSATNYLSQSPAQHVDDTLGIYKLRDWPEEYSATSLAVTQLYGKRYNRGESDEFVSIQHADIFVNYEDFQFGSTGFNLESVIVHELGHFLGLGHYPGSDRWESVMYPYLRRSDVKNRPTVYDQRSIVERYGVYGHEMSEHEDEPGEDVIITIELKSDLSEVITERKFF